MERDVRALLRGTKDGEIVVKNESDHIVKGEKIIIDETQRKPRGGVKVMERGIQRAGDVAQRNPRIVQSDQQIAQMYADDFLHDVV